LREQGGGISDFYRGATFKNVGEKEECDKEAGVIRRKVK
jgi:hypothetical protein